MVAFEGTTGSSSSSTLENDRDAEDSSSGPTVKEKYLKEEDLIAECAHLHLREGLLLRAGTTVSPSSSPPHT
jgi:hypothetical protein